MNKNVDKLDEQLDKFIMNNYSIIEQLNKYKILKQNLNSKKKDSIKYAIVDNPITHKCMLSSKRTFTNGEIETFTEDIKCPTIDEFNNFVNKNSNKIKVLTDFSFTTTDEYVNSLVDKDQAQTNYIVNPNEKHVLKNIVVLSFFKKSGSVVLEALSKYKYKLNIETIYNIHLNHTIQYFSLIGNSSISIKKLFREIEDTHTFIRFKVNKS